MRNLLSLCVIGSSCLFAGCDDSSTPRALPALMVYFDMRAQEAVVYQTAIEFPARHPVTNQPTLMPALYCARCESWQAVPPADRINRSPGAATCAKCWMALGVEGPWPEKHLTSGVQ